MTFGQFGRTSSLNRRSHPHMAVVDISIELRKIDPDGMIDYKIVSEKALRRYGVGPSTQLVFSAPSEAECIQTIKSKLEKLNE